MKYLLQRINLKNAWLRNIRSINFGLDYQWTISIKIKWGLKIKSLRGNLEWSRR